MGERQRIVRQRMKAGLQQNREQGEEYGHRGRFSETRRMMLVRGRNEDAELGQEKHQENVGEGRLFNKMFECSSKSSTRYIKLYQDRSYERGLFMKMTQVLITNFCNKQIC